MRIDELDSLRATALVMMLISNFVSDLDYFGIMEVVKGDKWWWLARTTAFLFVSISGISYFLAHQKEYDFMIKMKRTQHSPSSFQQVNFFTTSVRLRKHSLCRVLNQRLIEKCRKTNFLSTKIS